MLNKLKLSTWLQFALGALLCVVLSWSINKPFDRDELEVVHTTWKIFNGEEIYVDFFQHHHPLLYYLLIPTLVFFGETTNAVIAIRIIFFCLLIGILFTTYLLTTKLYSNNEVSNISLVLLLTNFIFTTNAIELRPDVPQLLFSLISVLYLVFYIECKSFKYLVSSSCALGIAFLFLQKALFLILTIFILLLYKAYKNQILYRDVVVYITCFCLTCAPYLFYLFANNLLSAYFTFNWILNIKFSDRSFPTFTLISTYKVNTFLWAYCVLGLLFFSKTLNQRIISFIFITLFFFLIVIQKSHQQYFMVLVPFAAAVAAQVIWSLAEGRSQRILAIVLLAIVYPCYSIIAGTSQLSNTAQLEKIKYVTSITSPKDFVYDGNIEFNVFRKDINFFWFSLDQNDALATYKSMTSYDYNVYELIERFKPKVISNNFIENLSDRRIANFYQQSPHYDDLYILNKN